MMDDGIDWLLDDGFGRPMDIFSTCLLVLNVLDVHPTDNSFFVIQKC
jgi:hypothetical protein